MHRDGRNENDKMDKSNRALNHRLSELEKKVDTLVRDAPWNQDAAGVTPHNTPNQHSDSAKRQSPLVPEIPPSPSDRDQSKKPWYKTLSGWKSVFEIVAIPFAVAYAVVTYLQWQDLRRNFVIDQRPWVRFITENSKPGRIWTTSTGDIVAPNDMRSLSTQIDIENIGKTAAREILVTTVTEILPDSQRPSLTYDESKSYATTSTGILFQDHTIPVDLGMAREITEDQRRALNQGRSYLVAYGTITYRDIFGVSHETRFCSYRGYVVGMVMSVKSCTNYNFVDSNY